MSWSRATGCGTDVAVGGAAQQYDPAHAAQKCVFDCQQKHLLACQQKELPALSCMPPTT